MGWYGSWEIKYNGRNSGKFLNLAKMIIPNYAKRFEETGIGLLECIRNLSWYSADVDISKIMEYLSETDTIDVTIDGETHPISGKRRLSEEEAMREEYSFEEDGEYYVYDEYACEKQTFRKQNGKVVIDNEHPDADRCIMGTLGVLDMLSYNLAYPESARESEQAGNTDTIDSYINYIANELAENEEMLPIVQSFMYDILNPQRLRDVCNEEYNRFSNRVTPDTTLLSKIADIREQFQTIESTRQFLQERKMQNPQDLNPKSNAQRVIPNFIANMSKRDIRILGGVENLLKLVEKKGETSTKEILSMLGYSINDGRAQEGASLEDLQFEKSTLETVKQREEAEYEQQLPKQDISIK